eukprot:3824971-Amphidinium_carterae.1
MQELLARKSDLLGGKYHPMLMHSVGFTGYFEHCFWGGGTRGRRCKGVMTIFHFRGNVANFLGRLQLQRCGGL